MHFKKSWLTMVASNQITPGMILSISGKLYRVESSVKVTVPKGTPFIKTKLKDLATNQVVEKNFKIGQTVSDVPLTERHLEYLYLEGKNYLFLDIRNLDKILIPIAVIGSKVNYLKEGVDIKASFYGDTVFSVELPQFLELMVSNVENEKGKGANPGSRIAILETGASVQVPPFIDVGDIIKVDTKTDEYIQRV
ncbi:Elongation factor P 1 [Parachlamydia acanthamoebae]|nr:Elongation factor P 1 [Parachlamydia acanthamoebae]